ncbi:uncharacterized protein [Scyliorhinus torazame]|uniref:uncharacterized protein isoform X4 n=1 Tax=Scyliorhinus torazame TaxID=75743 RepID=UPI003B5C5F9B
MESQGMFCTLLIFLRMDSAFTHTELHTPSTTVLGQEGESLTLGCTASGDALLVKWGYVPPGSTDIRWLLSWSRGSKHFNRMPGIEPRFSGSNGSKHALKIDNLKQKDSATYYCQTEDTADDWCGCGTTLKVKPKYRREMENLVEWCGNNHLSLNVSKTKELVIDFRKQSTVHTPVSINGAEVEMVSSLKFLGVHLQKSVLVHPRRRYHQESTTAPILPQETKEIWHVHITLTNFSRCTIESILSGCITAWYGNCSAQDHKKLQTAQSITQNCLPSIDSIYTSCCMGKVGSIIKEPSHPAYSLFQLLPSGRRYRSLRTRLNRLKNSFFPAVTSLLNDPLMD